MRDADWRQIDHELRAYGHGLDNKPRIIVLTKSETILPEELKPKLATLRQLTGEDVMTISAQTHQGVLELLRAAVPLVQAAREARARDLAEAAVPILDTHDLPDFWRVTTEEDGVYRVAGERIEGFARRTNFDQDDAVSRLRDILRKTGVARELRRQGAQAGDTIRIGSAELAWLD